MDMNKKEFYAIGIYFIVALLIMAVVWVYPSVKSKPEKDAYTIIAESNIESSNNHKEDTNEEVDEQNIHTNIITEILNSSEEIYLESIIGSNYLVYLSQKDKKNLEEIISSLDIYYDNEFFIEDQYFDFVIHLKSKNIKIFIGNQSIFIEDGKGSLGYWVKQEELLKFIDELKGTYLKYLNKYLSEIKPTGSIVEAMDKNAIISIDQTGTLELMEGMLLTDIVDSADMFYVPIAYPYYKLTVQSETRNAVFTIVDEEIVLLNIIGENAYFKYKPELRDQIIDILKNIDESEEQDIFERLFNSKKVLIDEKTGQFDQEDDAYYLMEIIRCLVSVEKEQMIPNGNRKVVAFELEFITDNRTEEVTIYDDIIKYRHEFYKSPKIADKIYKILSK